LPENQRIPQKVPDRGGLRELSEKNSPAGMHERAAAHLPSFRREMEKQGTEKQGTEKQGTREQGTGRRIRFIPDRSGIKRKDRKKNAGL
jgi:hypothetical protein